MGGGKATLVRLYGGKRGCRTRENSLQQRFHGVIHIDALILGLARCRAQDLPVIHTKITNFSVSCPRTQARFPSAPTPRARIENDDKNIYSSKIDCPMRFSPPSGVSALVFPSTSCAFLGPFPSFTNSDSKALASATRRTRYSEAEEAGLLPIYAPAACPSTFPPALPTAAADPVDDCVSTC